MRVHISIHGQVQGVFFRHSAKQEAERLGIVGWVRNNPDGSVEIEAEGDKVQLEEFVRWCQKGPPSSYVEKVDVEWGETTVNFKTFEILRV